MAGDTGADDASLKRSFLIEAIAGTRAAIADGPEVDVAPLVSMLRELAVAYAELTPVVMVSRCPYTAIPLRYPMDVEGLDGPYWDASAPIRHLPERAATVVAITGAVVASDELEPATFDRRLGPGHHVIHPSILDQAGTRVVLSCVVMGPHRILVTSYFQNPVALSLGAFPELGTDRELRWGSDHLPRVDLDDRRVILTGSESGWLDDDRIGWIDVGDEDWIVRTGRDGCPYDEVAEP